MDTERSEDVAAVGVSGLQGMDLLGVSEKHSTFTEMDWETPGFGLGLGSRPSECLRVWVLVPGLIKEMLFRKKKSGERCGYLVMPEVMLSDC